MALCYYITGHGYGHAVRTTQILKALPRDLPLILKTTAPERLFREELPGRDFHFIHSEYDCGCLQSDSVTVLQRETLMRYGQIAAQNAARLQEEVAFLQEHQVCCVASDVPPFPLYSASVARIPSVAIANFTWHDIYTEYVQTAQDTELLAQMAREYSSATVACITPLNVPTVADVFPNADFVPLVVRQGSSVRSALMAALNIPAGKNLALLYLGNWGLDVHWHALERLQDWVFLIDQPLAQPVSNLVSFDPAQWRYSDVAASLDAVVSKAGYGTLTECIANSVPLIYLPRQGFIEHESLVLGMTKWGGGIEIPEADFFAGDWEAALTASLAARPDSSVYATSGAEVIASIIMRYC